MKTTILGAHDIRQIAQRVGLSALMDETIAHVAAAFRDYDPEVTRIPVRDGFRYDEPNVGLLEWMPLLHSGERATIKIVGYHPANPSVWNVPTILSTIGLFDTRTGHLIGLVDGTFLTALRTGAASAVASRLLASPDSRTLGLVGAGAQAVTQFHALSRGFPIERVLVHDIDPSVVASFADRIDGLCTRRPAVEAAPVARVVAEADILCTQTSVAVGAGPVFEETDTKPWLHVNAVGSDLPGKTEVPLSLLLKSFVCPDFPAQALDEGECQQLSNGYRDRIGPSLDQIVKRPETCGDAATRTSVFDSTGFALEDHAAAELIFSYAAELGVGTPIELGSISHDPRDPYGFVERGAHMIAGLPADLL